MRLFAVLADIAGTNEVVLDVPDPAHGDDVFGALAEMFPRVRPLRASLRLAVNQEYVPWGHPVQSGDEVALIPPVSGGQDVPLPFIEVVEEPLSSDRYQQIVVDPTCGAVALFVGVVREVTGERRTVFLKYQAYKGMAEREMHKVAEEMQRKWPDARIALGHRVGELGIGEASVIVAVATPHRAAAFEAARFGIDTIKEQVPIWKKEVWDDGEEWVGIHA